MASDPPSEAFSVRKRRAEVMTSPRSPSPELFPRVKTQHVSFSTKNKKNPEKTAYFILYHPS